MQYSGQHYADRILKSVPVATWDKMCKHTYALKVGLSEIGTMAANLQAMLYTRYEDRKDILPTHPDKKILYLKGIEVDRDMVGKGAATKMMRAAIRAGKDFGADLLYTILDKNSSGYNDRILSINEKLAGRDRIEFHSDDFSGDRIPIDWDRIMGDKRGYCVLVDLEGVDAAKLDGPRYLSTFFPKK